MERDVTGDHDDVAAELYAALGAVVRELEQANAELAAIPETPLALVADRVNAIAFRVERAYRAAAVARREYA